jgi:hypothetical protein
MTWCSHISAFENEQLCRLSKMQKKMYYIDLLETIWPPPPTLRSKPTEHVEENVTTKHSPKPWRWSRETSCGELTDIAWSAPAPLLPCRCRHITRATSTSHLHEHQPQQSADPCTTAASRPQFQEALLVHPSPGRQRRKKGSPPRMAHVIITRNTNKMNYARPRTNTSKRNVQKVTIQLFIRYKTWWACTIFTSY